MSFRICIIIFTILFLQSCTKIVPIKKEEEVNEKNIYITIESLNKVLLNSETFDENFITKNGQFYYMKSGEINKNIYNFKNKIVDGDKNTEILLVGSLRKSDGLWNSASIFLSNINVKLKFKDLESIGFKKITSIELNNKNIDFFAKDYIDKNDFSNNDQIVDYLSNYRYKGYFFKNSENICANFFIDKENIMDNSYEFFINNFYLSKC